MSLGSELAAAREAQGLSLDDVAAATRIRATLIAAIEQDDFSSCGGAVYARGHVRSIARAVGLDPEPLLAQFDPPDVAVAPPVLPGGLPGGELLEAEAMFARKTRPQAARWGSVMVGAVAVVIALTVYSLATSSGKSSVSTTAGASTTPAVTVSATPSAVGASASAVATPTTVVPTTTLPTVAPSSEVALVARAGVTLRLRITGDRSWLHVANSKGAQLYEGTLSHGQTKDFTDAKQIRVIIGAPSAVDIVVNGTDIGSLPDSGKDVGHQVFTPTSGKSASRG